jgi:hypothetical protein
MEQNVKVYHIRWQAIAWESTGEDFSHPDLNRPIDIGLYQLYGAHPVYGQDVLLYIGKTTDSFGKRFRGHPEWNEHHIEHFTRVHLGRITVESDISWTERKNVVLSVERLLIFSHSPALNLTEAKTMLRPDTDPFIVMNWKERGQLLPEVSTMRFSFRYWSGADALVQPIAPPG